MKKFFAMTAMTVFVIVSMSQMVGAESIPPFKKAKEMALTAKMQPDGCHVLKIESPRGNEKTIYYMVYCPNGGWIILAKEIGFQMLMVFYVEESEQYGVALLIHGTVVNREGLLSTEAAEIGFKIFRELVAHGLL